MSQYSRRAFLSLSAAFAATAAQAEAPLSALRPLARPNVPVMRPESPPVRAGWEDLVQNAGLGDRVAVKLVDMADGAMLWERQPDAPMMPASTTKSVTTLYALDKLGADHRFTTRLIATGPVVDGKVQGDLVLAGGGDPVLDTDALAGIASDLAVAGVTGITGGFLVWGGALPYEEEIEPTQLDHLGYNPAVSGLNLNFNRVHFEWRRSGGAYATTFDARSATRVPPVRLSTMRIVDRSVPVYTSEGPDHWTVARGALGGGGARWLPVRQPALYAGEVFQTLAGAEGVTLPAPRKVADLPEGTAIVSHDSPPLEQIAKGMLLYSTNLTAEVLGLAASAVEGLPADIDASAARMNAWIKTRFGVEAGFRDHSGLSDENRVSAAQMVAMLTNAPKRLRPLLKKIAIREAGGLYPGHVAAKTGTLNFVSTLAGYVTTSSGRELGFAIMTADEPARERGKASGDEQPAGSISWNSRAKVFQDELLRRWSLMA